MDESTLILKLRIDWNEQFEIIKFEDEQSKVLSLEEMLVNMVFLIVMDSSKFSKEKRKPV